MKIKLLLIKVFLTFYSFCFSQNIDRQQDEKIKQLNQQVDALQKLVDTLKKNISQINQARGVQNKAININKNDVGEINNRLDEIIKTNDTQDQKVANLETFTQLNTLPVGTIVAYYGNYPPSEWAICDGHLVTDSKSQYYQKNVPDLRGYFIRGKTSSQSVGETGGSDYVDGHSHYMTGHKHEVGSHSHNFTTNTANVSCLHYPTNLGLEPVAGGSLQYFLAAKTKSALNDVTKHSHTGTTGNASQGYTAEAGSGYTQNDGGHYDIPKYMALNFIIKIK